METITINITSFNTYSERPEGLSKCIDSLEQSYLKFKEKYPDVKVAISWVDDASYDYTPHEVREVLSSLDIDFKLTELTSNSHQGYCRNLATKMYPSDYIMFLDSDDEFKEDHIIVCYELMQVKDNMGRFVGVATTQAEFDREVHPEWKPRISSTIPITKIFRREVFEFLEGFPTGQIYTKTGCEDQYLIQVASKFFNVAVSQAETVKYNCYEGSFFERQLVKFSRAPTEAPQEELQFSDIIRVKLETERTDYLRRKLIGSNWYSDLSHISTTF